MQEPEPTYYALLGLHPSASVIDIRRAYRELSKLYHPDTTELSEKVATAKFREINEAYAILSSPERRLNYDFKIGYSRFGVIQAPPDLNRPYNSYDWSKSAYLDATDRPLSSGELFALFILGLTFVGCLLLVAVVGLTRGDSAFVSIHQQPVSVEQQITKLPASTKPHTLNSRL
ncbi:molecular chaperone DnaJ [Calothrix sp. HK-06]|nr:molecular chaperone DnaJ [Calothrix sp. HK-06]